MVISDWVGRKEGDPRPIVYQGCFSSVDHMIMESGLPFFCLTFFDVWKQNQKRKGEKMSWSDKSSALENRNAYIVDWIGRKEGDLRPIVYHGGNHSQQKVLAEIKGVDNLCYTFWDAVKDEAKKKDEIWTYENGMRSLSKQLLGIERPVRRFLDSGAFSFLNNAKKWTRSEMERQVDSYLENYVAWVRKHRKKFDFYVTFDYVMEAPLIWNITKRLQKMGIKPVPVYHGDASISWLHRYIDEGHKLIGISKRYFKGNPRALRKFYDQVFMITEKHGVSCHGLAQTGEDAWRYPWYSVDSTTLSTSAGRGNVFWLNSKGKIIHVPVSERNSTYVNPKILETAELFGITTKELRNGEKMMYRVKFNGFIFQRFMQQREARPPLQWKKRTCF